MMYGYMGKNVKVGLDPGQETAAKDFVENNSEKRLHLPKNVSLEIYA